MKKTVNQLRFLSLALIVTISAVLFSACNNEGEKKETTTDTVAAPAPVDTLKKDTPSLPTIDTTAGTRPDAGTTGGAKK